MVTLPETEVYVRYLSESAERCLFNCVGQPAYRSNTPFPPVSEPRARSSLPSGPNLFLARESWVATLEGQSSYAR
jgi:hypothetical protein